MIVVQNRFLVAEGYEETFLERFEDRRGAVEEMAGFRRFELLRPADSDTATFVVKTYWDSMGDYEAWTDSEAFEAAHDGPPARELFEGHPTLEVHEVAMEAEAEADAP